MKKRVLISGRKVDQLEEEFPMTISSKCPDKWLFVDLETGDIWHVRKEAYSKKTRFPFWRQATLREFHDLACATKHALCYGNFAARVKP